MGKLAEVMHDVTAYIDNILLTDRSDDDHAKNFWHVPQRLKGTGLKLKLKKCSFLTKEVEYPGHIFDAESLRPTTKKLEAVSDAPSPKDMKRLQSYLGVIDFHRCLLNSFSHNFYRHFLPNLVTALPHFYLLLIKELPGSKVSPRKKLFRKARNYLRLSLFCSTSTHLNHLFSALMSHHSG